jgi:trimethylamine---corrinoid protein Co-methyltransferase
MSVDLNLRPTLSLLGSEGITRLHGGAVQILAETGLNVHHPDMRQKLADAGARLGDDVRVYLSEEMVTSAIQSASKNVVIHDRLGKPVMPLGPHQMCFGTGSDLVNTRDAETLERRSSRSSDVSNAARLCDALEDIDFVMSFGLPADVPAPDIEPRQFYDMIANTTKPALMTSYSGLDTLQRMHDMACLVAGGDDAFRARPNYVMYGQFVSPLQHDLMAVERLIFCADHDVPLIYIPTIMPGASGPVTLAGSFALAVAESLAGLVMHQTQRPGAPFIFGACVSQLDMRTMLYPYGSPEWRLNDLAMAELSRHYGLPVFGTGGSTDSKTTDAQTGAESALGILAAVLAGTNLIHDVGYLESGLTGSLESIVLGAEHARWARHYIEGFDISAETLALDVIHQVGPGKQFLDQDHTIRHLRSRMWHPYVSDRDGFDAWESAGSKDYAARARDFALDLLKSHEPDALAPGIDKDLRRLANVDG